MGIKEKDLQTVNSIEGGKLRCITANGESRNIDADAIQSSSLFVIEIEYQNDESSHWFRLLTPFEDIQQAYSDGKVMIVKVVQEFTGKCMYTLNNLSYGFSDDALTGIQCMNNYVAVIGNTINLYYEEIIIGAEQVTNTVASATLDGTITS